MPELPDVETLRRYFSSTALHQKIESVETNSDYVLKDITPQWLGRKLSGNAFSVARRHGKFFFAGLEQSSDWLLLHFGMTGNLKYYQDMDEQPQHELVAFHFDNGYTLAYVMTRKLGEVRIISGVDEFIQKRNLGPDVCGDDFTWDCFKSLLHGRHGMIKPTLMNQSIMAGIGNVYSDEILYQSRTHPKTPVNHLTGDQMHRIYDQIDKVLRTAIDHQADPNQFPDSYITPLRGQDEADCPGCSGKLAHLTVSGRTSYYCPDCQELA